MSLTPHITNQIKELVYKKPRSISEIALALDKNWRTIDRYVEQIMQNSGELKTTTFRGGTRGALKIVYWNNNEHIYASDVQKELFAKIELGIEKTDFSPLDIYQYIASEKRTAYYEEISDESKYQYRLENIITYFENTNREILIFVGNLRFLNFKIKQKTILQHLENCVKRGVSIKIITNVNIIDKENVSNLLSLNIGLAQPLVVIKHAIFPLRCYIFDDSVVRFSETVTGDGRLGHPKIKIACYYELRDTEWILWLQKIFWKEFQKSIPANMRIETLQTIQKMKTP
jgi:hypothetical protein